MVVVAVAAIACRLMEKELMKWARANVGWLAAVDDARLGELIRAAREEAPVVRIVIGLTAVVMTGLLGVESLTADWAGELSRIERVVAFGLVSALILLTAAALERGITRRALVKLAREQYGAR